MADPTPLDAIAYIHINLFGDEQMSVSGNIGDVKLALQMLDHARDAVKGQITLRTKEGLFIPSRDVDITPHPAFPLTQYADVAPALRPVLDLPK